MCACGSLRLAAFLGELQRRQILALVEGDVGGIVARGRHQRLGVSALAPGRCRPCGADACRRRAGRELDRLAASRLGRLGRSPSPTSSSRQRPSVRRQDAERPRAWQRQAPHATASGAGRGLGDASRQRAQLGRRQLAGAAQGDEVGAGRSQRRGVLDASRRRRRRTAPRRSRSTTRRARAAARAPCRDPRRAAGMPKPM